MFNSDQPNPDYPALPTLEQLQRACDYGDGLFESIRLLDGHAPLLERHWERLSAGLLALGYTIPPEWNAAFFQYEIQKAGLKNARARLSVWRSPGGLYAPKSSIPLFRIQAQVLAANTWEWLEPGLRIGISEQVRLPVDSFSGLKTLNAPRYVAASIEAGKNDWDEALVLNSRERVCEATTSNVFWWEGERLCTVPLSEGCVAGVMRSCLLDWADRNRLMIIQKPAEVSMLQEADEIFLTNAVRGVIPVRNFAGRPLSGIRTRRLFNTFAPQIHLVKIQ